MARGGKRGAKASGTKPIDQYEHADKKRANNPQVGLVGPENDPDGGKKKYAYDPHLDPQLVWAGVQGRDLLRAMRAGSFAHLRSFLEPPFNR